MPLQGSLGHLGLADLLQTGLAGRAGGYLSLRRGAEHAIVYVGDDGLYLLSPDPLDPVDVVAAFERRGLAPADAVKKIRRADAKGALAEFNKLVEAGVIPQAELMDLLASTAEDMILDLLTWEDGSFRYEERALDARHVSLLGRIGVDPGGVLLRAAQRMDERSAIARDLGLYGALFVAQPVPQVVVDADNEAAADVHALLDGQTLVTEAALLLGIGHFATLKCVHALVSQGAARQAMPGEIAELARARLESRQFGAARSLALHWVGLEPINPEPVQVLIEVAVGLSRFDDEMAARCALGNLLLHTGQGEQAVRAFQGALDRAPQHEDALAGMRMAAQSVGDERAFARATLTLANASLDGDDEERAARLGDDLCRADPKNIEAHLIRARAMLKSGNRERFIESAETVSGLLGRRARRQQDRDTAKYFRDTVAQIAPERGDLLKRFRGLVEGQKRNYRRAAMLIALVGLLGTAGVVLWPASPSGLLSDAQAAYERGERTRAQEIVAELIERFPDSPEAESAFQLQTRILYPNGNPAQRAASAAKKEAGKQDPAEDVLASVPATLAGLPTRDAIDALQELVELLERPTSTPERKRLFKIHGGALPEVARRLQREARAREDVIAQSKTASHRLDGDAPALRDFLARVTVAQDPVFAKHLEESVALLERIGRMRVYDTYRAALFSLRESTDRHARAITAYADAVTACQQALVRMNVDALFDRCTKEAPALLVGGRLDEADALYMELETLIAQVNQDPKLEPVRQRIERLRIDRFLRDRRGVIAGIKRDLKAAVAAEAENDLEAAGQIYTGLVKRHWQIRFENVFTMPLQVDSVPSGAQVEVNGKAVGKTPLRVRYPWGTQTTVVVSATGFGSRTHVVNGGGDEPETRLDVRLPLAKLWSADIGTAIHAAPVALDKDVLVVGRGGRITLHDGKTGDVRWSRHYKSIEGIRSKPVVSGGDIVVGYVDGTVKVLTTQDGTVRNELQVGRLAGDLDAVGDLVAAVNQRGELITIRHGREVRRIRLGFTPTAGLVAAHGAFWLGTADGSLVRVDARTLRSQRIRLGNARGAVLGLHADADGILVSASGGRIFARTTSGSARWEKDGLGDLVGAPVRAGSTVAIGDRRGRISLFDARGGQPLGLQKLGAEPIRGIQVHGKRLLAGLGNGRLWVYDAASRKVVIDAPFGEKPQFGPADVGHGRVALCAGDGRMTVVTLPK